MVVAPDSSISRCFPCTEYQVQKRRDKICGGLLTRLLNMANLQVDFPGPAQLQRLISSFPLKWQGLFAALNVPESQAIPLGAKWLREKSFSLPEGHIPPHWSSLLRALTLPFPVIYKAEVVFRPKFSCLTLKLQRNLLSFIVVHSESVSQDDLESFLAMLLKLQQSEVTVRVRNQWMGSLTYGLQAKINGNRLKTEQSIEAGLTSSGKCIDLSQKARTHSIELFKSFLTDKIEIPDLGISKRCIPKLDRVCSSLKDVSFPGSELLACNIQLACCHSDNIDVDIESGLDKQTQPITAEEMDIDVTAARPVDVDIERGSIVKMEVIEITDDPLEMAGDVLAFELPAPPGLCNEPEISEIAVMEEGFSEIDNIPDKVVQLKENFKSLEEFDREYFLEFVTYFQQSTPRELKKFCMFMEMDKVPETATMALINKFLLLSKECSFQSLVVFADYCIGSKLRAMEQAVSRNMLAAIVAFAKTHPKAFVDGVVVRLVELELVQWPQSDLILKVFKGALEKENLKYFMGKVLNSEKFILSIWNDHIISIFSVLIDMKLEMNKDVFDKYVVVLRSQSTALASNLKFAKMLLLTINKYGPMVRQSRSTFQQMLEENNTFLKKSALTALKKL